MKKITLRFTLIAATALTMVGCDRQPPEWTAQQDTAICVDRNGNRVPDVDCNPGYHSSGMSNAFLWYYLGRNSVVPYYGQRVAGGSFTRTAGATYFHAPVATSMSRAAAISRGGFGSSAHAFGGFGE